MKQIKMLQVQECLTVAESESRGFLGAWENKRFPFLGI